jgi:hypothetical protein
MPRTPFPQNIQILINVVAEGGDPSVKALNTHNPKGFFVRLNQSVVGFFLHAAVLVAKTLTTLLALLPPQLYPSCSGFAQSENSRRSCPRRHK